MKLQPRALKSIPVVDSVTDAPTPHTSHKPKASSGKNQRSNFLFPKCNIRQVGKFPRYKLEASWVKALSPNLPYRWLRMQITADVIILPGPSDCLSYYCWDMGQKGRGTSLSDVIVWPFIWWGSQISGVQNLPAKWDNPGVTSRKYCWPLTDQSWLHLIPHTDCFPQLACRKIMEILEGDIYLDIMSATLLPTHLPSPQPYTSPTHPPSPPISCERMHEMWWPLECFPRDMLWNAVLHLFSIA